MIYKLKTNPKSLKSSLIEKVVHINRCTKVVKGGRRFRFSALVVVGDGKGSVSVGHGKAQEVTEAIRKALERARGSMELINIKSHTIPHEVIGKYNRGRVVLLPACNGTGIIACSSVRYVLESVGIKNILSKSLGSNHPDALVKATLNGLRNLRTRDVITSLRNTKV